MQVLFKDRMIFDLQDKIQKDLHYLTNTTNLKKELIKKTLRYTSGEFQTAGFFQLHGMKILFLMAKFNTT